MDKSEIQKPAELMVEAYNPVINGNREKTAILFAIEEVTSQKKSIDASIDSDVLEIQKIFCLAEKEGTTNSPEEIVLRMTKNLFTSVTKRYGELKEKMVSPELIEMFNSELITKKLRPRLDRLVLEGKVSPEDASEYIDLIKKELVDGSLSYFNSKEKNEEIDSRSQRIKELNKKSDKNLDNVSSSIFIDPNGSNGFYNKIFELLFREASKQKIEQLRDYLSVLNPDLQLKIFQIANSVIDQKPDDESNNNVLDISKLSDKYFKQIYGLERYPIIKEMVSPDLIPKKVFSGVEKVIVQKLYENQEEIDDNSFPERPIIIRMLGDMNSPDALPFLFRDLLNSKNSSSIGIQVIGAIENICRQIDLSEIQRVSESMPKTERVVLGILADKDSYFNRYVKDSGNIIMQVQNGDFIIAKEKLAKILETFGNLNDEEMSNFYLGYGLNSPGATEVLLGDRTEVENIIIDSKLEIWTKETDNLLSALVNPDNGEVVSFPKKIAQNILGNYDEKRLKTLGDIFDTKTLKGSDYDRELVLDGLILLNSKENGKEILEKLLDTYRGTKTDPSRLRHIFQMLITLDNFGEFEFVGPEDFKIIAVKEEIERWQANYLQTQDKIERKKIKDKLETLNNSYQNLTGLKGIEEVMAKKVAEIVCIKLELIQEGDKEKIQSQLDELMKNGFFDIIQSLAGKYEDINETDSKKLLMTIVRHIIDGDFKKWRYSHEYSEIQLAGLTGEQKELWKNNLDPIIVKSERSQSEEDQWENEFKVIQKIVKNAKAHILESQPGFTFSEEKMEELKRKVIQLTEKIKTTNSGEEKRRFIKEKRKLQTEYSLIHGILKIESADPKTLTSSEVIAQSRELYSRINELSIPLVEVDITQIEKIFTVGDLKQVVATESDDSLTLFKVGTRPIETCQSWRDGGYNRCLVSYVANSNTKVINLSNGEGKLVSRSIIKLTDQRELNDEESRSKRKTILAEKQYSLMGNYEISRAFISLLLTKAKTMGISVTIEREGIDVSDLQIYNEEASKLGYEMEEKKLEVFIPKSMNGYDYSDTLGGEISSFDRFKEVRVITFEKLKT